ncbi:MAG: AI-2E family transporter [Bacteroidaceae bacterium]|nr:AI-2E family transporter [Bacteroidaceae bacterium]MBR4783152.1 AI-2E family transporter [Bacteroidaceae bacterium]
MKPITFDSFIRGGLVVLSIVLIVLTIDYLSVVLVPFFVAWFLAYLVNPVVDFFQHKLKFKFRVLAILATLLLIGGIITGIVLLVMPSVAEDFQRFVKIVDNYLKHKSYDNQIEHFLASYFNQFNISKLLHDGQFVDLVKTVMPRMISFLQHTAGIIVSIFSWGIAVLYFFFILYDYDRISQGFHKMVPRRYARFTAQLLGDLERGMNAYFRGQFLIALCVGILFCIGFTIIDFPLAIPMGLLIGALSFIPYLHALGLIPALLLCILKSAETGQNFWIVAGGCAAVFIVVQVIEDAVLTPRIMGKAIGLPPYLILLSLSVWGYLLGIIGMIIALPVTTLICSYYKRYIAKTED